MKIIRFEYKGATEYGMVDGDTVFSVDGSIYGDLNVGKELCKLSDVRLLAPVQPRIVVGVGVNYPAGVKQSGTKIRTEPIFFFKPSSTVIGPLDNIVYPKISTDVRLGGELAVVIKYKARNVAEDRALDYVLGYTCGNDVTAADFFDKDDGLPTRAKSFDTFCPVGPCIVTDIDGGNLKLRARLNGVLTQDGSTSDMIFRISKIVSCISAFMSLEPGDIILTGSTETLEDNAIHSGDIVEVEIEGIGILRNSVT